MTAMAPFAISPAHAPEIIISEDVFMRCEHDRLYIYDANALRMTLGNRALADVITAIEATGTVAGAYQRIASDRRMDGDVLGERFIASVAGLLERGIVRWAGSPQRTSAAARETTEPCAFDGFIARISERVRFAGSRSLERPLLAEWEITNACNLSCFYCYHGENKARHKQLDTDEALSVVRNIAASGVMQVTIEGGEPFVRRDLERILRCMKAHRIQVRILTNGTLLGKERARELGEILDRRMDVVQISLDGSRPETHELSRGQGTFAPTVRAIEYLGRVGLPVQVSMVVHSGNLRDVLETYRLVGQHRAVVSFVASHFMKAGDALNLLSVDKLSLLAEYARVREVQRSEGGPPASLLAGHLLHIDAFAQMCRENFDGPEVRYCRAGRAKVAIDANGDVYPCHFLIYPEFCLGNLREQSLLDVWRSGRLNDIREPRGEGAECFQCDHGKWCGKKCMGLAWAHHRDLDRADPNCEYAGRGAARARG